MKKVLSIFVLSVIVLLLTGCEEVKIMKCEYHDITNSYKVSKEYIVHSRKKMAIRYIINSEITSSYESVLKDFYDSYIDSKEYLEKKYNGIKFEININNDEKNTLKILNIKEVYEFKKMNLDEYSNEFITESYIVNGEVKEDDIINFLTTKGLICKEIDVK